ncbi:hypothetical protein [uncultured Methanobrevibacter sp.]|uniref:hypothetical protein n=1 Tax=uncultured Methanobrevibacter sp. TaxID=253161 RepID=UPI0025E0EB97|nr:hypothetical protein [uncultured Methanobrevibacter sp.]
MKNLETVFKTLTDKEKLKEVVKKVNETSKEDKNKDKLRSSSKNLLKQAEEKSEKIKNKQNKLKILRPVSYLKNNSFKKVIEIHHIFI